MISGFLKSWRWRVCAAIIIAILIFLGVYFGALAPDSQNTASAGVNNSGFYLEP